MGDKWLIHKFGLATKDVADYKKHLLRAIHQDRSKTEIMDSLSPQTAMIIFDFAMKFLPVKYREAQKDFLGRKVTETISIYIHTITSFLSIKGYLGI